MSKPFMFRFRAPPAALCLALAAAIAGCYESPTDVTNYDPGVYKGERDPLLSKQRDAEHLEELAQRFNRVQTDR